MNSRARSRRIYNTSHVRSPRRHVDGHRIEGVTAALDIRGYLGEVVEDAGLGGEWVGPGKQASDEDQDVGCHAEGEGGGGSFTELSICGAWRGNEWERGV